MIKLNISQKFSPYQDELASAFDNILRSKKAYTYSVDVRIVKPETIKKLNYKFRHIDKPTDVLSFPLYENLNAIPSHSGIIGDLVLCPEMMDDKHLSFKESLIHGILHLLGFDHEKNEAEWNKNRKVVQLNEHKTS